MAGSPARRQACSEPMFEYAMFTSYVLLVMARNTSESTPGLTSLAWLVPGRIDFVVNLNAGTAFPGLLEEGGSDLLSPAPPVRRQFPRWMSSGPRSDTVVILGRSESARKPELLGLGVPSARAILSADNTSQAPAPKAALHALAGTLSAELVPLNILVPALAFSAFCTAIYAEVYHTANAIVDYNQAIHVLVDVVRRGGVARGKVWPVHGLVLAEHEEKDGAGG
ncbi:hypothetical protein B0H15DRAFT_798418 [Mycena belliarum]|uniref:Uncharacterized protein n=1 Tax=Mycena belliarum TaxID=1033014 RepID=A0AAD6U9K9_9AGAR|nr:hypothetical protein B0H15DRAFT_798418 [Mycena belliae]